ncbi:MAG: PIN domain-containing protein [Candidatus Dormibacteria bacterium]
MQYLLDANVCIALINDRPGSVRARFQDALVSGDTVAVSSIVTFEFGYGGAKSTRRQANSERVAIFLAGPVDVLPFDAGDARAASEIRAALESAGTPIGAYDVLIAGQAVHRGATLATAHAGEFARVRSPAWTDWAAAV